MPAEPAPEAPPGNAAAPAPARYSPAVDSPVTREQWWTRLLAATFIVAIAFVVLRPFLTAIAWAAILAYATWPAYHWLRRAMGRWQRLSAGVMTMLVILVVVIPTVLLSLVLVSEVQRAAADLRATLTGGVPTALARLRALPWVGPEIGRLLVEVAMEPARLQQWVLPQLGGIAGAVTSLVGDAGRLAFDALLTLLVLLVLYHHGDALGAQVDRAARRAGGPRLSAMLVLLGQTVRAVMYGTLFTALTQGMLVTIGCWMVGIRAPVLLGAIATILSLVPGGVPLVWGPVCVWLALDQRLMAAGFMLAWGLVVVSTADNVIRSWFLSGAVSVPFVMGLFGMLGGLVAFGTIGLFIGPVAVSLLLLLWREWTEPTPAG